MCSRYPVVPGRGVNLTSRPWNNFQVFEVSNQRSIIRVQQPRTTDQRKRDNVLVIGIADIAPTKFARAGLHVRVRHASCSPESDRNSEPPHESVVSTQLPAQSTPNDQLPTCTCQPLEETFTRRGSFIAEHLVCHIRIDNSAH